MSAPKDILFTQRFLAIAGLYPAASIDGKWGPKSQGAADAFDKSYNEQIVQYGRFDPRTETVIHTLLPKTQVAARKFMVASHTMPTGFMVRLGSGTRSCAEQNALYAQGRTAPGNRVTSAPCGFSNHNYGLAFDADLFHNDHYLTGAGHSDLSAAAEEKAYIDLSAIIKVMVRELEWGGDWRNPDRPHYQLKTIKPYSMTDLKGMFEKGIPYV